MKRKGNQPKQISNRRARFDYELSDSLLVGIVLSGGEVRALRTGHGQLRGAYVTIKDGELWLINATISGTNGVAITESQQTRTRKLLAHKRDIERLQEAKQNARTIVPLEILTSGRYIKVRIAIGKGKREYDKRETLKARQESRQINAALKTRFRS